MFGGRLSSLTHGPFPILWRLPPCTLGHLVSTLYCLRSWKRSLNLERAITIGRRLGMGNLANLASAWNLIRQSKTNGLTIPCYQPIDWTLSSAHKEHCSLIERVRKREALATDAICATSGAVLDKPSIIPELLHLSALLPIRHPLQCRREGG
jgi:hypothetical protein